MEEIRKAIADTRKGYILATENLETKIVENMLLELRESSATEERHVEVMAYILDALSPTSTQGRTKGKDPSRKNILDALPDVEFANKYKAMWDADGVSVFNKGNNCVFIDPYSKSARLTEEGDGKLWWKDKPRGRWLDAAEDVGESTIQAMLDIVHIFKQRDFSTFTTTRADIYPVTIIASNIVNTHTHKPRTLRRLFFMTPEKVVPYVFNTSGLRAIHLWFGKPVEELTCHLLVGKEVDGQPTVALLVTDGVTTAALAYMVID